jgi:hypothetical protein
MKFFVYFFFLTIVQRAQCDFWRKFDTDQSKTKLFASDLDKFWRYNYTCCYIYVQQNGCHNCFRLRTRC